MSMQCNSMVWVVQLKTQFMNFAKDYLWLVVLLQNLLLMTNLVKKPKKIFQ